MGQDFVMLSLPPLLIGTLAAIACALPGNFLLLRRQSMLGDAISHVVLPGIVMAFLLTGSVGGVALTLGAGLAALVSVGMVELLQRAGRVEPGAAMGVTFTTMFAAGVLLLERSGASAVHLDVQHALYGNLESLIWFDATGWASILDPVALAGLPPELGFLAVVAALVAVFVIVLWRPLKIATFDEGFAATLGMPVRLLVARADHGGRHGLRCGIFRRGVDPRHRHAHLPPGGSPADDGPPGTPGGAQRAACGPLGLPGLCSCRLRTALAGAVRLGQCGRDDRCRLRRDPRPRRDVRSSPAEGDLTPSHTVPPCL